MSALAVAQGTGRQVSSIRVGVRNGEIVMLKRCQVCGLEKIVSFETRKSEFPSNGIAQGRRKFKPQCKPCYAKKIRAGIDKEVKNAQSRRTYALRMQDPELAAIKREQDRQRRRRSRKDANWRRNENERSRRWKERKRAEDPTYFTRWRRARRQAQSQQSTRAKTYVNVPVEPFYKWCLAYQRETGLLDATDMATDLGLCSRRMRSVYEKQYQKISVDLVDTALSNARHYIEVDGRVVYGVGDLYPEYSFHRNNALYEEREETDGEKGRCYDGS